MGVGLYRLFLVCDDFVDLNHADRRPRRDRPYGCWVCFVGFGCLMGGGFMNWIHRLRMARFCAWGRIMRIGQAHMDFPYGVGGCGENRASSQKSQKSCCIMVQDKCCDSGVLVMCREYRLQ